MAENAGTLRRIRRVIRRARPSLQVDGGDIQFLGYAEGVVRVRLRGRCRTCSMWDITLREAVERPLKQEVPEVERVVNVI